VADRKTHPRDLRTERSPRGEPTGSPSKKNFAGAKQ
jgi:hypothetical protein